MNRDTESSESDIVGEDGLNQKVEISMEEAIKIGTKEAVKYYDNLELAEVHSYDNDYERSIEAGSDGKREWWYVDFKNEKSNYVIILIRNGEIIAVDYSVKNEAYSQMDYTDIKMTSYEAVTRAIELGMRGGDPDNADKEWVSGYNFRLQNGALRKSPDDRRIFLSVIGISPNGNFARVDFDATTGELLLAEEKFEYEDGSFAWKEF